MQTILKSMHKCRSYGPDNLMNVTLRCDLDLHPTYKKVSNDTTLLKDNKLCQIILKSMHKCRSYDPDKSGRTHARTHAHTHAHTP